MLLNFTIADILQMYTPLERCFSVYYVSPSWFWRTRNPNRAIEWSGCDGHRGFQESTRKWETSGGERVGLGWHNEWHIVKSLPTKQSLHPCKWDSLDKDLFDGTHAEYEAANSLISIQQSWLAKTGEGASRRAFLQNPILICLMVSGSQKSQISCRLFMRLFSGPIDAPRLINTSLRRCDYMLELLMGPLNFKEQHKRCFDKRSWGKRHIWWASVRLWMWGLLFVSSGFCAQIIHRAAALEGKTFLFVGLISLFMTGRPCNQKYLMSMAGYVYIWLSIITF